MPKIALGQTYDVRLASRSEKDALTSISAAPLTRLSKPRAHLLQTAAVVDDLPGLPPAAISRWLAIGLMLISLQMCTNDDTKPKTHSKFLIPLVEDLFFLALQRCHNANRTYITVFTKYFLIAFCHDDAVFDANRLYQIYHRAYIWVPAVGP